MILEYSADEILVGDKSPEMTPVMFTLEHDERFIGLPSLCDFDRERFRADWAVYGVHLGFLLSR